MFSFFSNVINRLLEGPFPWTGIVIFLPYLIFIISKVWVMSIFGLPERVTSGRLIILLICLFVYLVYAGFTYLKGFLAFSLIMSIITFFSFILFSTMEKRYLVSKGYQIETSSDFASNIFYPDFVRSKNSDE